MTEGHEPISGVEHAAPKSYQDTERVKNPAAERLIDMLGVTDPKDAQFLREARITPFVLGEGDIIKREYGGIELSHQSGEECYLLSIDNIMVNTILSPALMRQDRLFEDFITAVGTGNEAQFIAEHRIFIIIGDNADITEYLLIDPPTDFELPVSGVSEEAATRAAPSYSGDQPNGGELVPRDRVAAGPIVDGSEMSTVSAPEAPEEVSETGERFEPSKETSTSSDAENSLADQRAKWKADQDARMAEYVERIRPRAEEIVRAIEGALTLEDWNGFRSADGSLSREGYLMGCLRTAGITIPILREIYATPAIGYPTYNFDDSGVSQQLVNEIHNHTAQPSVLIGALSWAGRVKKEYDALHDGGDSPLIRVDDTAPASSVLPPERNEGEDLSKLTVEWQELVEAWRNHPRDENPLVAPITQIFKYFDLDEARARGLAVRSIAIGSGMEDYGKDSDFDWSTHLYLKRIYENLRLANRLTNISDKVALYRYIRRSAAHAASTLYGKELVMAELRKAQQEPRDASSGQEATSAQAESDISTPHDTELGSAAAEIEAGTQRQSAPELPAPDMPEAKETQPEVNYEPEETEIVGVASLIRDRVVFGEGRQHDSDTINGLYTAPGGTLEVGATLYLKDDDTVEIETVTTGKDIGKDGITVITPLKKDANRTLFDYHDIILKAIADQVLAAEFMQEKAARARHEFDPITPDKVEFAERPKENPRWLVAEYRDDTVGLRVTAVLERNKRPAELRVVGLPTSSHPVQKPLLTQVIDMPENVTDEMARAALSNAICEKVNDMLRNRAEIWENKIGRIEQNRREGAGLAFERGTVDSSDKEVGTHGLSPEERATALQIIRKFSESRPKLAQFLTEERINGLLANVEAALQEE